MSQDDPLLTPAEVAAELRLDLRTVYKILRERPPKLRHLNLGYKIKRIRRSDLDAYKAAAEEGE